MFSKWRRKSVVSVALTLILVLLFWAINGVIAQEPPPDDQTELQGDVSLAAAVNSRINYQGILEENGTPVNGTRDITFDFFTNASCSGAADYNIMESNVPVNDGFFDVDVDVIHSLFSGEGVWLEVTVDGTTFDCEEILPVPYALSLRPGATIVGEESGTSFGDAMLNVENDVPAWMGSAAGILARTATGSAVRAESNSVGVYAESVWRPAVIGQAITGTAAVFDSGAGYGIRVNTNGEDHWDHAGYFTANGGYGLYVTSTHNMAVRGESGDTYGGYFYSQNARGVYASSDPLWYAGFFQNRGGSSNAGIFIDGTLTASGSKSGYVVDVMQNAGPEILETGDVVVIVGVAEPVLGEIPVIQVRKATEAASTAVTGVVDQPFSLGEGKEAENALHPTAKNALMDVNTAVKEGAYVSVVTLGAFKAIRVDATYGAIKPGDLLVSSPTPGHAMYADTPASGAVIGKALEAWDAGQGTIAVMVTLQ